VELALSDAKEPEASAGRFPGMEKVLLILALWCVPSMLLVAVRVWHLHKAELRVRQLHLDDMVAHAHAHRA
jgi:hypothetical protein